MAAPLTTNRTFVTASAPTSGSDGTGADTAQIGDLLVNHVTQIVYVCTAKTPSSGTNTANSPAVPASITWTQIA
jgi:hypothetical protein